MKIQFCGATTGVTGSCHLIKTENHNVLLDCGQFQGGKAQEAMNREEFPFDPKSIECMVLSHAHIDHCGRIPLLVKRGYSNPIYCTSATADLLKVMLEDSAYIHMKDAEWETKKSERKGGGKVEPLYTIDDATKALELVVPVEYDQQIELNEDIKIVFNDAGHILGSAITELWIKEGGNETKVVFSGDLGMMDRPILNDPTIIKKADAVIMESTYGNRLHPDNAMDVKKLIDIIIKTTDRGGCVVIPSFAVGRSQELLYELNKFYDAHTEYDGKLDKIKVYIDSPMATTATEVFRANAQVFDEEARKYILSGDDPLDFRNLYFTRSTEESQQLNYDRTPKVIISASGMCEAGRIRHHLKHHLWDKKSSIVFVGFQAVGTLGRTLLDGNKDVSILGEEIHVEAEIYNLEGFSAHADQNGLMEWLSGFEKPPKQLFLVHGEQTAKEDLAKLIREKLGYSPVAVTGNSEYELEPGSGELEIINEAEAKSEAAMDEEVQDVRKQICDIHDELENIIYNANMALEKEMTKERLSKINNFVQSLNKASMDLAGAVLDKKGDQQEGSGPEEKKE